MLYPAVIVVVAASVAAAVVGGGGVVTLTRSLALRDPKRANVVFGACLPVYMCVCALLHSLSLTPLSLSHSHLVIVLLP